MALAACLVLALVVAGCGASGAPAAHEVTLSITAPTDGATVGVRQLEVAGTVTPGNAAVTIAGRPVPVRNGQFLMPMQLAGSSQTITVTGRARGYRPARTTTTVSYSSQTAVSIQSGHKVAAVNRTPIAHKSSLPAFLGPAFEWPGGIEGSTAASTTASSSPGAPAAAGTSGASQTPPGAGGPTAGPTGTPAGGTAVSGGATGSSPPAAVPQPWTPGRVRNVYLQLCIHGHDGVTAFCQCTYQRMARAKALRSRASLVALVRKLKRFDRTHNLADLPRFMRSALLQCVQKLPGNDPSTPRPVKRLPGLEHPSAPAPSPTSTTASTTTTAPTTTTTTPAP